VLLTIGLNQACELIFKLPVFVHFRISRSKALEADEALLEILERRLANPDAAMSIPIDFVVQVCVRV